MSQPFSGQVIAITGAASGIGLACAHLLASRGAQLSLADLSLSGLHEAQAALEKAHGASVLIQALDVQDAGQVERWIAATVTRFGRLDGAANVAGVIPASIGTGTVATQDLDEWGFVLGVNLTGVLHCLRAQLPALADHGAVVNMASIAGVQGRARNASYAASKHGVVGLTRSAAKEVGPRGVRVNAVCPGRIETPMARSATHVAAGDGPAAEANTQAPTTNGVAAPAVALGRAGKPEEVAQLVAFLLGRESAYITGQAISIDGGWNC